MASVSETQSFLLALPTTQNAPAMFLMILPDSCGPAKTLLDCGSVFRGPFFLVIAQAELEFANGKKLRIGTDESWLWHPSPNTTIGVWDFRDFGGESYDAR